MFKLILNQVILFPNGNKITVGTPFGRPKKRRSYFMHFIIFLFSLYAFIETMSYGIFEYKKNSNKVVGIFICILAIFTLIVPNLILC